MTVLTIWALGAALMYLFLDLIGARETERDPVWRTEAPDLPQWTVGVVALLWPLILVAIPLLVGTGVVAAVWENRRGR